LSGCVRSARGHSGRSAAVPARETREACRLEVDVRAGLARELAADGPLLDRLVAWRDQLLGSARFRRWAAAFPLTRPIARRRAAELFDLCAGFVYSQILLACVRLRVPEVLAEGPQTVSSLSRRLSLSTDATLRLLQAAVTLRLAEQRGNARFGLGVLGAALIENPGVAAMIEHHALLYADLGDPVALLRAEPHATSLSGYWAYARSEDSSALTPGQVAAYTTLMSISQPLVAGEILDAYPLEKHRCLLDVGGGDGTFLAMAARRAPSLNLILFDLPPVADRARARFAAAGLAQRAAAIGGDFLSDPLPRGADVVSLVRVLHDHDYASALAILRAIRRALPDGGTLVLGEPMSGTRGAERMGDAYFGFYLLAMGSGRPRDVDQLTGLLRSAGFRRIRSVPTRMPLQTSLVVAKAA
jgi:demethylspheroidene O-methyltransferase